MKRILKYGLLQGVIFIISMTAISYWISGNELFKALTIGFIGGTIVAIFNSFLFYKFAVPKYIIDKVSINIDADEKINFQTPAIYTSEQVPISGKIFITNKRLIFRNHSQEKNKLDLSIPFKEIKNIETFKTLKFFLNGFSIYTNTSESHNFIVDKVKLLLIQFNEIEKKYNLNT